MGKELASGGGAKGRLFEYNSDESRIRTQNAGDGRQAESRILMSAAAVPSDLIEPVDSNGFVQKQFVTLFEPPKPLRLKCGQEFGPITVAYQTYGELSPRKDNAVFICHALTGDSHVAGRRHPEDRKPGWWDGFVGPGKGIDTNKLFVICANVLGGCQGTTGPNFINAATGNPYGPDFPFLTVSDMVQVHQALVEHLGISKLLSIVGGSLGGMQVLEWAAQAPDSIASAIVLASGSRLSAQGIAFNAVGRRAIVTDPSFNSGNFYGQTETPRFGLALARMIAHITYLSEQAIERKFGRRLQHTEQLRYQINDDTEFQIESYLNYQGKRFVERFDANSYLRLTRAMDYFDLERDYGPMAESLARTAARFLVVSYNTDWLFPTEQSRQIVRALVQAGRHVSFAELNSPHGHDAFLVDSELPMLARLVAPFLDRCYHDLAKG
jgi:homoserine O-acetyltransferase/O-succinyltransferase